MTMETAPAVLMLFSALVETEDWAGAVRLADDVYASLPGCGNPAMHAMALQKLALAFVQAPEGAGQDSRRATSLLEEAEGMFAAGGKVPNKEGQAATWESLEAVLAQSGRLPEAAKWTTKLLAMFDERGDSAMVGEHASFIGEKLVRVGGEQNCKLAVPLLERALLASASPGVDAEQAADLRIKALSYLGTAKMDLGSFDQALTYTSLLVKDMEKLGDVGGVAGALRTRAMIHDRCGARVEAIADLEKLLEIAVPGCSGLDEETRNAMVVEAAEILKTFRADSGAL